jgi:Amt family ammonium transporter
LIPLLTYLITETLRVADDTGVVAMHLAGSLLGLLGLGLLADGRAGAGWNGIGTHTFLGIAGQGITGLWPGTGFQPDWPGQLQAQAVAMAALFLIPFLAGTLLFGPVAILQRGLHAARRRPTTGQAPPAPLSEALPVQSASAEHEVEEVVTG